MSDAADMLGLTARSPRVGSAADEAAKLMQGKTKPVNEKKTKKPKGMKREVFDLIGTNAVKTAVQAPAPLKSAGLKSKRVLGTEGKWLWACIDSSARTDGFKGMHHWVRADKFYSDYPYAQFNVKLDAIQYTDEQYALHLSQPGWSRDDTNTLLSYCHAYDLRWAVIADRIELSVPKSSEELQARFYFIASTLASMAPAATYSNAIQPFKNFKYDLEGETGRRKRQDALLLRSPHPFTTPSSPLPSPILTLPIS